MSLTILEYNTALAKLLQGLKRDAGAETIRQNYRGTGKQAFRRQLYVHFKSGAVIDLWLESDRLGFGGCVCNRPQGSGATLPRSLPYGDDEPEVVYAVAAKMLAAWAMPAPASTNVE